MRLEELREPREEREDDALPGDRDDPEELEGDGDRERSERVEPRGIDGRERLIEEDPVEREQDGDLDEDHQDAREGVHLRFAIERERLESFFLFIALMPLLQLLK